MAVGRISRIANRVKTKNDTAGSTGSHLPTICMQVVGQGEFLSAGQFNGKAAFTSGFPIRPFLRRRIIGKWRCYWCRCCSPARTNIRRHFQYNHLIRRRQRDSASQCGNAGQIQSCCISGVQGQVIHIRLGQAGNVDRAGPTDGPDSRHLLEQFGGNAKRCADRNNDRQNIREIHRAQGNFAGISPENQFGNHHPGGCQGRRIDFWPNSFNFRCRQIIRETMIISNGQFLVHIIAGAGHMGFTDRQKIIHIQSQLRFFL